MAVWIGFRERPWFAVLRFQSFEDEEEVFIVPLRLRRAHLRPQRAADFVLLPCQNSRDSPVTDGAAKKTHCYEKKD